jgi:hypothetical protein
MSAGPPAAQFRLGPAGQGRAAWRGGGDAFAAATQTVRVNVNLAGTAYHTAVIGGEINNSAVTPPSAGLTRLSQVADVCALGRLVARVCAMTSAGVARLIYPMLLARMSSGQWRDA